jgi:hypothetical protein
MNKNALVSFAFWFGYHEIIASIISYGTGFNWLILQIFVVPFSLVMMALTMGSQNK